MVWLCGTLHRLCGTLFFMVLFICLNIYNPAFEVKNLARQLRIIKYEGCGN